VPTKVVLFHFTECPMPSHLPNTPTFSRR
jgi:hypothetical protein